MWLEPSFGMCASVRVCARSIYKWTGALGSAKARGQLSERLCTLDKAILLWIRNVDQCLNILHHDGSLRPLPVSTGREVPGASPCWGAAHLHPWLFLRSEWSSSGTGESLRVSSTMRSKQTTWGQCRDLTPRWISDAFQAHHSLLFCFLSRKWVRKPGCSLRLVASLLSASPHSWTEFPAQPHPLPTVHVNPALSPLS